MHNVKTSVTTYIHAMTYIHVKPIFNASADDMVDHFCSFLFKLLKTQGKIHAERKLS